MRTCCCCGRGYRTNVKNEDVLIYGCRGCCKGDWNRNEEALKGYEITRGVDCTKDIYHYGKPKALASLGSMV